MRSALAFVAKSVAGGMLLLIPLYLAILLLLKAMKSVVGLVRPFARLLPESLPAERLLSLFLVLVLCFLIGAGVRTRGGRNLRERLERAFFERIPGYALLRSLTQQMAGDRNETAWRPALIEIEEGLVPGFVIEELEDGRYTVFVPSIPTPLAGAVYVLDRSRVHPLEIEFTAALRVVSKWGSGAKHLVAAMEKGRPAPG